MSLTVTQTLRRAQRVIPRQPAVTESGRTLDWATLHGRVARLAGGLRALGCRPGDRVAMLSQNSTDFIAFYLAVPWADLVMVTLNTRWSEAEIVEAMQDSGARVLILDDGFLPMAHRISQACPDCEHLLVAGPAGSADVRSLDDLVASSEPVDDALRADDATVALFYTGGTTGRAKGVMLCSSGLVPTALALQITTQIGPDAVVLQSGPLFHMAAGGLLYATLCAGAHSVILPGFDPAAVLRAIEDYRITHVLWVPTMLEMLLSAPELEQHDLSSIECIMYGAAPMPQSLLDRAMTHFPNAGFIQFYGMTELSPLATCLSAQDHLVEPGHPRRRSVGRPGPNVELRIVDGQGENCPPHGVGEILVRSPGVMQGYWQQPEATAAALERGWMHTGDAGYVDEDGYVYIVDRIKDMIISGGENIYSVEVENALHRHPAVAECAVVGVADPRWGEIVCAVVHLRAGADVGQEELLDHCRELIAGYKCPKQFVMHAEPLPKTAAGKIRKAAIRAELNQSGELAR